MRKKSTAQLVLYKYFFILVFSYCKGDYGEGERSESDDGLSLKDKLVLYSAAIGTFLLLGSWLSYCALFCSKRRNVSEPQVSTTHHLTFEAKDLWLATRGYHESNLIGSTPWASVFKGTLQSGLEVAIKRFHLSNCDGDVGSFVEVTNALGDLRHRNLVRVLGLSVSSGYKELVMEYVDCETLGQLVHGEERNCSISWETRIKIAQGTARALVYLHEGCRVKSNGPLIHGNLNPRNIFVDIDDQEPLLSDFGIAFRTQHFSDSSSVFQQVQEYAPPEFKRSQPMTTKSDVFSYGMVLLELVTLKRPTSKNVSGDMVGWVRDKILHDYGEVLDPAIFATATISRKKKIKRVLGLALMCTRDDPETRPSMNEVLEMLIQMKSFRIHGNAVVANASEIEEV